MKTEASSVLPISVIIPSLNRSQYLLNTIRDMLSQNPPPLEIIVIDQSKYHPVEIKKQLQRWAKEGSIVYECINVQGASVASNHGILKARGEILLFIDDDIQAPPDLCANHYRYHCSPYSYDAVSGLMLPPEGNPQTELPREYYWPQIGWMFQPLAYAYRLENFNLSTCNMSIKRELALAVKGFDENLPRWQDSDFSWRVKQIGARTIHAPDVQVVHLLAPSGAARYVTSPINKYVLSRREFWYSLWYLCLKNFHFFNGWRLIWFWGRRHVFRRVLLTRPHYLLMAIAEFVLGFINATATLRASPRYILAPSQN